MRNVESANYVGYLRLRGRLCVNLASVWTAAGNARIFGAIVRSLSLSVFKFWSCSRKLATSSRSLSASCLPRKGVSVGLGRSWGKIPSTGMTEIAILGSPSAEELGAMLISFLCKVMLVLDSFHHGLNSKDQADSIPTILHYKKIEK
jgi:hypothetical protein